MAVKRILKINNSLPQLFNFQYSIETLNNGFFFLVTERCLNPKLKSYKHTDSEKCCAFWVCINGKSVAKCCGKGYKFEDERGCVKDPTCNALCPWEDEVPGMYKLFYC